MLWNANPKATAKQVSLVPGREKTWKHGINTVVSAAGNTLTDE